MIALLGPDGFSRSQHDKANFRRLCGHLISPLRLTSSSISDQEDE